MYGESNMETSTPVFLPRKSHGQRNLAGYSAWGHKESDTTEQLTLKEGKKLRARQGIGVGAVSLWWWWWWGGQQHRA